MFQGKRVPTPPVQVVFKLDDEELDRVFTDEESGGVMCDVTPRKPGGYIVHAFLVDDPSVRRSKRILVKKELKSTKIPKFLNMSVFGERGKQKLLISVGDGEGSLIGGFTGTIVDGDQKKSFTTDPEGACLYETNFSERNHPVEVQVGSDPDLIWIDVLSGPNNVSTEVEEEINGFSLVFE